MMRLRWTSEVGSSTTLALFVPGTPVNSPGNKRNNDQKYGNICSRNIHSHTNKMLLNKKHLMEESHTPTAG